MRSFASALRRAAAITLLAAAMPAAAQAGTTTSQFRVTLTIQAECKITSATDIAFGTTGVIQSTLTSTGTLGVQCTNTTPYNVGLSAGAGSGASVTTRRMSSSGGATVDYSLYRDAAGTLVWGDTVSTNTQAATGNGAIQSLTVYGRVPAQTTPAAGSYSDTVQVTVTY